MVLHHITYFLKRFGISDKVIDDFFQKLEEPCNIFDEEVEALYIEVNTYINYQSYLAHKDFFAAIHAAVTYFFTQKKHYKNRQQIDLYLKEITAGIPIEHLIYIYSIETFSTLVGDTSYMDSKDGFSSTFSPQPTHTMIEVLESAGKKILDYHEMFFCQKFVEKFLTYDILYKNVVHQVLYIVAEQTQAKYFVIQTSTINEVMDKRSFEKIMIGKGTSSSKTNYNKHLKLTTISLTVSIEPNYYRRFRIFKRPCQLIKRDNSVVVVSPFGLVCKNLVTQKFNKKFTEVTTDFLNKVLSLTTTGFVVDEKFILSSAEIIDLEWDLYCQKLKDLKEKSSAHTALNDLIKESDSLQSIIKNITKSLTVTKSIRNTNQKNLHNLAKNEQPEKVTIKDFCAKNCQIAALFKRIEVLQYLGDTQARALGEFQAIASKVFALQQCFSYMKYLSDQRFEVCYFHIYTDFRGRLYYDSQVSVQSYWCYRFLYTFATNDKKNDLQEHYLLDEVTEELYIKKCLPNKLYNKNLFELYQSLGFLFKKTHTKDDGQIDLIKIREVGIDFYCKHQNTTLKTLWLLLNKDSKLTAEAYYYVSAIKRVCEGDTALFYIWKDTTCSMSQHAGKLLGYQPDSMQFLNLCNEKTAYDTYVIYIRELVKLLKQVNPQRWSPERCRLLNRDFLKNLIMTREYGVTSYTATREFIGEVRQWLKKDPNYLFFADTEVFEEIFKTLGADSFDKIFYHISKDEWLKRALGQNCTYMELEDIKIHTTYYSTKSSYLSVEVGKQAGKRARHVVSVNSYWEFREGKQGPEKGVSKTNYTVNQLKTKAALRVNAIHALDALYLRNIAQACQLHGLPLAAIHDGFATPYTHGSWIISTANACFFKGTNYPFSFYWNNAGNLPNVSSDTIII